MIPRRGVKIKFFLSVVIYVVKAAFVPFSATGGKPAIARAARLCGLLSKPRMDRVYAHPNVARYQLRHTRIGEGVRRPITDGVPLLYQIFFGLARGKSAVQSGLQSHHTVGSLPTHAQILTAHVAYYCVTQDREWLRREGFPLMREAARFWCDRVTANADGSYSIRNVIGANEYAVGVTDNAFTNGAARRALEYASAAAELCGERPDPQWSAVAAGLRIPHFADGTTREHAGYDGEMIKQADANLLGYPLGIVTGREAQLRDLEYYERRIDPRNGPAMSYSVFAIQYARLGMAEKACEMFRRSYLPNLRPPFGVFAETATSGNPYFMTGAGGMLQAVLFGFGGLEITADGLVQRPSVLPPQWKNLRIKINGKIYQATNQ